MSVVLLGRTKFLVCLIEQDKFPKRCVGHPDSNANATKASHATMTSAVTAPAVILAFSFSVLPRIFSAQRVTGAIGPAGERLLKLAFLLLCCVYLPVRWEIFVAPCAMALPSGIEPLSPP
jgi:hypothetical protein